MVNVSAGRGPFFDLGPRSDVSFLLSHFSLGSTASGACRARCRLTQRAVVSSGCAAGRTSALAGCELGLPRGCEEESFTGLEYDLSSRERGEPPAPRRLARFRIFAWRSPPRAGHAVGHQGDSVKTQKGRSVSGVSVLRPRQSSLVVQSGLAAE